MRYGKATCDVTTVSAENAVCVDKQKLSCIHILHVYLSQTPSDTRTKKKVQSGYLERVVIFVFSRNLPDSEVSRTKAQYQTQGYALRVVEPNELVPKRWVRWFDQPIVPSVKEDFCKSSDPGYWQWWWMLLAQHPSSIRIAR